MAAGAIVDVPDTFFQMLGANLRGLMLMAAITGVTLEIAFRMARRATGIVRTGQSKETAMIENCRLPRFLVVALRASVARLCMDLRRRCFVTRSAAGADFRLQQIMGKHTLVSFDQLRAGMIAMASHAIGLGQCLMKGDFPGCCRDRHAVGCPNTDLRNFVAVGATVWRCSHERRVACKAIVADLRMCRSDRPRRHHRLRPDEGHADQSAKA